MLILYAPSGKKSNPPVFLVLFKSLVPTHVILWYNILSIVSLSCGRKNGTVFGYTTLGFKIGSGWYPTGYGYVGYMEPSIPLLLVSMLPSLYPNMAASHYLLHE